MKKFTILSNNYTVTAGQELISELFENELDFMSSKLTFTINWYNFNQGSIYYDNNGKPYTIREIDHINKTVKF
ncbi:MAG TPA: hypothetical protein DEG71_04930 [Clostridiales bacterium]|nr:hypothetical protein [Clostridiales bacterium]